MTSRGFLLMRSERLSNKTIYEIRCPDCEALLAKMELTCGIIELYCRKCKDLVYWPSPVAFKKSP